MKEYSITNQQTHHLNTFHYTVIEGWDIVDVGFVVDTTISENHKTNSPKS